MSAEQFAVADCSLETKQIVPFPMSKLFSAHLFESAVFFDLCGKNKNYIDKERRSKFKTSFTLC